MFRIILTCAALLIGQTAQAQNLLDQYVAYISTADIYNSKGARLKQPWQVLRQDRANFHRFGLSQEGDEWDSFFARKENRATMERMLRDGYMNPDAARAIVSGGVYVIVRIYGSGSTGRYIEVDVAG